MKIRNGYVSNSSSSSFCVLGIIYDDDFETKGKISSYEGIYKYYGYTILGVEPTCMSDDETLLQFKERICEDFKKMGITVIPDELDWFIDGGYDG